MVQWNKRAQHITRRGLMHEIGALRAKVRALRSEVRTAQTDTMASP